MVGLLVVVGLVAVVGFVVLARPFGDSPGPSSSAGAQVSAATTPPASNAPTPAATASAVEPSARPTAEPTAPPTAEPTVEPTPSTPVPSDAQTASCRSEVARITVAYPAAWQTYTGDPKWTCLLFDPDPITIVPDSELPDVAVGIYPDSRSFAAVQADFTTTSVYTVLATDSGTVDGHDATASEVENTGAGFYEKGVRQTVVIVDLGDPGVLVLQTVGKPGTEYDTNVEVLTQMVGALQID